jgi:predicted nucleic acid-binding protein
MILDAGPLIAIDRNRRTLAALMDAALEANQVLHTSEAIVAQVWRSPKQANLGKALNAMEVHSEFGSGRHIGELLAKTGTSDPVDAHLAVLARRINEPILTSDVDDFSALAAQTQIRVVRWQG